MRRAWVAVLAVALTACGEPTDEGDPGGAAVRPGAQVGTSAGDTNGVGEVDGVDDEVFALTAGLDLLRVPERLEPEAPGQAFAPEDRSALQALLDLPRVELRPDDWQPDKTPGRWRTRPGLRLDLGLGAPWVTADGVLLTPRADGPGRDQDVTSVVTFVDEARQLLLTWDAVAEGLQLLAPERPALLTYGYDLGPQSWLARLVPAQPVARVALGRTDLDRDDRRSLAAPAGSAWRVPYDARIADTLSVSVGVDPLVFTRDGHDRLARVDAPADARVTFRVEHETLAGVTTVLWTREVRADEGWVAARVDLGALPTGPGALRLLTEAPADQPAGRAHGAWGPLVLRGGERQAPTRPHVIVVDVDTLRADRLGCYGYARDTTPTLDAWAAEQALVFRDASAPGTWTLPSTVSMLTGLAIGQHGVSAFPRALDEGHAPLAARLAQLGYETWGRTDGGYVSAAFGFGTGFDRYDYRRRPWVDHERDGWDDVLAAMSARDSERPLFAFLQTYQVHMPLREDRRFDDAGEPYDGPLLGRRIQTAPLNAAEAAGEFVMGPRDERWISDLYDAAVFRMDVVVGRFLRGLDAALDGEPHLVVFTSDHGEELHDHGGMGHGARMHREVVAVPLIVRAPRGDLVGQRRGPATGLDIVPTVLHALGLPAEPELPGTSLLNPLPERRLVVAEYAPRAFAARFDGWTLLRDDARRLALYQHEQDAAEQRDLLDEQSDRAQQLAGMVKAWQDGLMSVDGAGDGAVGGALVEELRALGYLGGEDG